MDISETYSYLFRAQDISKQIKRLQAERAAYLNCLLPSGITYDKEAVQTSPTDQMSEIMGKVDEIDRKITEINYDRLLCIAETTATIKKLDDEMEQAVLISYYLAGEKMEKVAEEISCATRHAFRIKRRAVRNLSKIL